MTPDPESPSTGPTEPASTEPSQVEPEFSITVETAEPPKKRGALRDLLAILVTTRLVWFASITAAVVLTVSRFHASTGEYRQLMQLAETPGTVLSRVLTLMRHLGIAARLDAAMGPVADHIYWFVSSLVLFMVIPLLAAAVVPGIRIRELGVGTGDWRYGLKAFLLLYCIMLPFVVAASFSPTFVGQYPMSAGAATSWRALISYQAAYYAYFIGWEFVYRGLLCVALYPQLGAPVILLSAIPFGVMHAGKPELEAFGSIVAAIALGAVAVRARSFWYGALLHSAVAGTMDALALTQTHRWPKTW